MDTELDIKRINAYREAPESVRSLYCNLELGGALGELITKFALDETKRTIFINVLGDAILGFFQKGKIQEELVKQTRLSNENAEMATQSLQKFITLIESEGVIPEAPKDLREELELRPETASKVTSSGENVRPLTRDEVLKSLSPSRTMAGDIASAQQNNGK